MEVAADKWFSNLCLKARVSGASLLTLCVRGIVS